MTCLSVLTYEQRQTVISQFFQMDRLVVEGGKTVSGELESTEMVLTAPTGQGSRGTRRHNTAERYGMGLVLCCIE